MDKTRFIFALGTTLMLAGSTMSAQGSGEARRDTGRNGEIRRGPGDGMRDLLTGITLTEDQKAKVKAIDEQNKAEMDAKRDEIKKTMDEVKALREKGDSAGAAEKMRPLSEIRRAYFDKRVAQLRAILTPEQQKQLDANVAELKAKSGKPHGRETKGKAERR
jgi:Spy/CpxP family protein refolding chaperone